MWAEGSFEGGRARNLLANWATGDTTYVINMIHRCQHPCFVAKKEKRLCYSYSSIDVLAMVSAEKAEDHDLENILYVNQL
jgi:hypothetical protein